MPSLDAFGKLAIVTVLFYIPIAVIAIILVLRHGFKRESGWIFLCIFSIIRIVGGILLVIGQLHRPITTGLFIGAYICEAAGLSPLLMATLGFLRTIGKGSFSDTGPSTRIFALLHILGTVALGLSVYGGVNANDSDPSKVSEGTKYRHIGVLLFGLLYLLLTAVHVVCWMRVQTFTKGRRTLLIAISSALPFLGIRLLYSILSSFSGSLVPSTTGATNTNSLAKFNMATGEWGIYLAMSLIMEYVVVCVYTIAGSSISLEKDIPAAYVSSNDSLQEGWKQPGQVVYATQYPLAPQTYAPQGQAPYMA